MKRIAFAFGLLLAGGIFGLAAQAAGPAAAPRSGAEIYADKCVYCHDARGWGTRVLSRRVPAGEAQLVERSSLPAVYTAMVVRRGIGSMPQFNPSELSDEEIAVVAKWLEDGARARRR